MRRPPAPTELDVLATAEQSICQRVPSTWRCGTQRGIRVDGRVAIDAVLTLSSPDGETLCVAIEAKTASTAIPLATAIAQLARYTKAIQTDDADHTTQQVIGVVAAPYLSPASREKIIEAGFSYVDTTGNIRVSADRPALFLSDQGADRNPWPQPTGIKSLKGPAAGAAVRALLDFRPPYGIRELATRSGSSVSTLSRVTELLSDEDLVTKNPSGAIESADWMGILRRWVLDYSLLGTNAPTSYLAPRGIEALFAKLPTVTGRYAVSGTPALPPAAISAPTRLAIIYADHPTNLAAALDLHRVDEGANCILLAPFDQVVFERTRRNNGVEFVAVSQLAADLMTGPGRAPTEADVLMDWMEENQDAWRL